MLLLLQRSISDYFYSLAKKDRNVKTLFSIFSKTEKGFLKTSVETKPFLFPYILSITNWKRNVKRFLFNWNYAGKSLPGFLSTYIRIAKIRTRNQAPKHGLWYLYIKRRPAPKDANLLYFVVPVLFFSALYKDKARNQNPQKEKPPLLKNKRGLKIQI